MRQRRLMNQINVVPYIDVMLVLLVIFMVTAPMIQQGTINVPSAGAGTLRRRPRPSSSRSRPTARLRYVQATAATRARYARTNWR